jgi:hypothetical protein
MHGKTWMSLSLTLVCLKGLLLLLLLLLKELRRRVDG